MSRLVTVAGLVGLVGLACACGAASDESTSTSDDLVTSAPKPPAGLMMRDGYPPGSTTQNYMTSSVAMIDWSEIQPGGPTDEQFDGLDTTLSKLLADGISHVRLRIMAGGHVPTWVARLGAPDPSHPYFQGTVPKSVIDCTSGANAGGIAAQNVQGATGCVPFFWTKEYLDAYRNLMTRVKSHLDSIASQTTKYAEVPTVVDSACMVVYAEVFYRGQGKAYTNQTLYAAGLTHTNDINCQKSAITIHKSVFGDARRTSVAINDWDIPQGTPGGSGDYHTSVWYDGGATWATYDFAEWARQELDFGKGTLLEVQNNGLHSTSSCGGGGPTSGYFCYIAQYPGRHGFQTQTYEASPVSQSGASLTLLEDLDNGLAMHAEYIELPAGMKSADWKLMACYDSHLRTNDASPCPH